MVKLISLCLSCKKKLKTPQYFSGDTPIIFLCQKCHDKVEDLLPPWFLTQEERDSLRGEILYGKRKSGRAPRRKQNKQG